MKLNNKGLSIVELIISIALISIVMVFMYRLITDVTFEKDNDYFASLNQDQRVEIIDTVQAMIKEKKPIDYNSSSRYFNFEDSEGNVVLYIYRIDNYTLGLYNGARNDQNLLYKWTINGGTIGNCSCEQEPVSGYITCTFPIYTTNSNNKKLSNNGKTIDNNNTIDDLTFTFKL